MRTAVKDGPEQLRSPTPSNKSSGENLDIPSVSKIQALIEFDSLLTSSKKTKTKRNLFAGKNDQLLPEQDPSDKEDSKYSYLSL